MSAETPKHKIGKVLDALDIRYLSLVGKGRFALPIGNGDLADMVWTPDKHS